MRVSYGVIVPVVIALTAISLFLGRLALRAQRTRPTTGAEGLIGERGVTLTPIGRDRPGQIRTHGEIWRAVSGTDVAPGQTVRVTASNGLTLYVEPVDLVREQGEQT